MRSTQSAITTVFRALGDDTRLTILGLLRVREACVCELVELLGISQPAVSEHLRRLREAHLVIDERRGMWVFYRLPPTLPDFVAGALGSADPPTLLQERLRSMQPADTCARKVCKERPAPPRARQEAGDR